MTFRTFLGTLVISSLAALAGDETPPPAAPVAVPPAPSEAGATNPQLQKATESLANNVEQADKLNEDLAKILAQLRAQKGLPPVAPYTASTEILAEKRLADEKLKKLKEEIQYQAAPPEGK